MPNTSSKDVVSGVYVVDTSLPSEELVYGLINHDNGTSFNKTSLLLSKPITNPDAAYYRNTRIRAAATSKSDWTGQTNLYYDRISIADYLKNELPLKIPHTEDYKTTRDLTGWLQLNYNLGIVANEIDDQPLDFTPNGENNIVISQDSLAWMGGVNVIFEGEKVDINDALKDGIINAINVVSETGNVYSEFYSYCADTSGIASKLRYTSTGNVTNNELALLLTDATNDYWEYVGRASARNLYNAKVIYNGRIEDSGYIAKPGYNTVIIITLDNKYCPSFEQNLVFYYNR